MSSKDKTFELTVLNPKTAAKVSYEIQSTPSDSKTLLFRKGELCTFQVYEPGEKDPISEVDIRISILIKKYEEVHKKVRNKKLLGNDAFKADTVRIELRDVGQTLIVGYLYKYDRIVSETGSLSLLMHPTG